MNIYICANETLVIPQGTLSQTKYHVQRSLECCI